MSSFVCVTEFTWNVLSNSLWVGSNLLQHRKLFVATSLKKMVTPPLIIFSCQYSSRREGSSWFPPQSKICYHAQTCIGTEQITTNSVNLLWLSYTEDIFLQPISPSSGIPGCLQTHYVSEINLKFMILLPLSPKFWDYRPRPQDPIYVVLKIKPKVHAK